VPDVINTTDQSWYFVKMDNLIKACEMFNDIRSQIVINEMYYYASKHTNNKLQELCVDTFIKAMHPPVRVNYLGYLIPSDKVPRFRISV
jgi:hypothetical protein